MALGIGKYARFAVGSNPPPGVDINANSALLITAQADTVRGMVYTVSRQGKYVGEYPASILVEVRAPT